MEREKSFTLIELLVVIAVIGLISSIVLVSLKGTTQKARIAKVLEFSHSINHVLGAYAVGIWSFNEGSGTTARDASGYGNHGTIHGASYTSDTPHAIVGVGEGKWALSFDGVNDVVTVPNFGTQIPSKEITIETWVKPDVGTGHDDLICTDPFEPGGSSNRMNVHFPWDSTICWQFGKPFQGVYPTLDSSWVGVWGHYVFTASYSRGVMKIYRNGVEVGTGSFTNPYDPTTQATLRIGGRADFPFQGGVDEVRIYNRVLTAAEIQKHYAEGLEKYQNLVIK